jgi:nucleoside-diphosphate-sugar epimerase
VLLESAERADVRRILVLSSMSAYPGTHQVYGQAKLAIEDLTIRRGGIAVRPGLVYGSAAGGMVGTLLKLTRLPVVPIIAGDARQFPVRDEDLADAIMEVLEAPFWMPEVFGIAQPNPVSFQEILATLAQRQGRSCRFLAVPWRGAYWALRVAEALCISLPLRSDSVLGLVKPAPLVPPSRAFPDMLDKLCGLLRPVAVGGQFTSANSP